MLLLPPHELPENRIPAQPDSSATRIYLRPCFSRLVIKSSRRLSERQNYWHRWTYKRAKQKLFFLPQELLNFLREVYFLCKCP